MTYANYYSITQQKLRALLSLHFKLRELNGRLNRDASGLKNLGEKMSK